MKKFSEALLFAALITFVSFGSFALVWACCGQGTEPIWIKDVTATPNPVACAENTWQPVTITFTVFVQGYTWPEPGWEWGATYADVTVGGTVVASGLYVGGMTGTYTLSTDWTPTAPGTYTTQIDAYNEAGTARQTLGGPDIVVDSCCFEGVAVMVTPDTFNIERAGNWVMGHVTAPEGSAMLTQGTIVSIGGIPCAIKGTAEPGEPIKFSSAEFTLVAEQIVPDGAPRAEGVEVIIETEYQDGTVGCNAGDLIDIINEPALR
jgi:hypothetical protein